jgi:hypothetical protein
MGHRRSEKLVRWDCALADLGSTPRSRSLPGERLVVGILFFGERSTEASEFPHDPPWLCGCEIIASKGS